MIPQPGPAHWEAVDRYIIHANNLEKRLSKEGNENLHNLAYPGIFHRGSAILSEVINNLSPFNYGGDYFVESYEQQQISREILMERDLRSKSKDLLDYIVDNRNSSKEFMVIMLLLLGFPETKKNMEGRVARRILESK